MNLNDYRSMFVVVGLVLSLVVASPTFSLVLPFPRGEDFSELWLLGPGHMAEDYPFNAVVGEEYRIFVGVGCHIGKSTYYTIYVKFRNQSQPLPSASTSEPSPLAPLYEFRTFIEDEGIWEAQVNFAILDVSAGTNSTFVGHLSINDVVFEVNCTATWDSEFKGFFYQLFFELWMFDDAANIFEYHNRFVGIWLNMTA